jgi:hypothetical protein
MIARFRRWLRRLDRHAARSADDLVRVLSTIDKP